ncbi:MAG: alcohol dehydrogenase catalytic domain-containing protein [Spirochaetes bacterium]|nr:alcohol dehydrogenase catalytic domain-containing protein [Spirochaetota bacterium]
MRVMVLKEYNKPLVLEEREKPEPAEGEVVMKVSHCGICGTDLKISTGKLSSIVTIPYVPGHEIVGSIDAVGKNIRGIKEGDTGIAYFYIPCGECELCRNGSENVCYSIERLGFERDGGFSEYVRMPAYSFCGYTGKIAGEKLSVLPDAVATSYHAIKNRAALRIGQTVLIVGTGGLGIHAVQIAGLMGAEVIAADIKPGALDMAKTYGARDTFDPDSVDPLEAVMDCTSGKGADIVIDNVGTDDTLRWSLPSLKRGGTLVMVGYDPVNPVNVYPLGVHYNEWSIRGARVSTKQELLEVIDLVESGMIDPVVKKVIPLEAVNEGLDEIREGKHIGRIVLKIE